MMDNESTEYEEKFNGFIDDFYATENPRQKIEALESAIRMADAAGDISGAYNVRMTLVREATFSGYGDRALVAFTWCLAQSDKDPEGYDPEGLLWKYKWIVGGVVSYPGVSKEKIFQLQDDFERRLLESGYNIRPVNYLRWKNAMRMGDFDRANVYFDKWEEVPRDGLADCLACELNSKSDFLGLRGDFEDSGNAAGQLINGQKSCSVIPEFTYGHYSLSCLKLDRIDELQKNFSKWYKAVKDDQNYIGPVSKLMVVAAALEKFPKAIAIFEQHAPWVVESSIEDRHFVFFSSAAAVFKRLASTEETVRMNLPDEFECKRSDHEYQTSELADWLHAKADALAKQFDERNGNDYYSRLVQEAEDLAFRR